MLKHLESTILVVLSALTLVTVPKNGQAAEPCGRARIRSGSTCESLEVAFDLTGCGETQDKVSAQVICRENEATAKFVSDRHIYQVELKQGSESWMVNGKLSRAEAKKAKLRLAKVDPVPVAVAVPVAAPVVAPVPTSTTQALTPAIVAPPVVATPPASEPTWKLGGNVLIRGESHKNYDLKDSVNDVTRFVGSRFRLDFQFMPRNDVFVFVQPQFTKIWGKNELVGTTSTGTSGTAFDPRLDVHQAYVNLKPADFQEIIVGRQELSYGDELVIGSVIWSLVGRSFDAIRTSTAHPGGKTDLFWSKLVDRTESSTGTGDKDFYGAYTKLGFGPPLASLDFYLLHVGDSGVNPPQTTTALGTRAKSAVGSFDYRAELTWETVKGSGEYQLDLETGYLVVPSIKGRVAAEYFYSTKNYDQLFPTAHKWLGYADYFSRRNIKGARFGWSNVLPWSFSLTADYHLFYRTDTTKPGYNFAGGSYGTTGNASAIADEIDVVLTYKMNDIASVNLGGCYVIPKAYFEANKGDDLGSFYYVQLNTRF